MVNQRRVAFVALGGFVLAVYGVAVGAPLGSDPISIEASKLDLDLATGIATLGGGVSIKRGELTLACPSAEVCFDRDAKVLWAKGFGPVVATFRDVRADAKEVEVDAPKQRVELRGGVTVKKPGAELTAQTAVLDGPGPKLSLIGVKAVLSAASALPVFGNGSVSAVPSAGQ